MGPAKIKRFLFHYCLFAVLAVFFSCAQVGSPSGGPQDKTAPKIVRSIPENYSVEYKGNNIILAFDEYVQLQNVTNELLISPPLDEAPKIKIKGKSVVLEFESQLKDSTTYTLDFGKSISDFTEGNPLDSNVFVFSTGNFLDSISFSGVVKNILDGTGEKDIYVMLYANLEDSIPYKEKPYYLTRTKENGSFKIPNIKKGEYRAFALKDLNNNLLFDQPTELIGFADSLVRFDSSMVLDFGLFEEVQEKQFVKKTDVPQYGKVNLVFNQPVDSISLYPISPVFKENNWFMEEKVASRDTFSFWLTNIEEGLESIELLVKDHNTLEDTINFKIGKKEKVSSAKAGRKALPLILDANLNASVSSPLPPGQKLSLAFSHPLGSHDLSKAILVLAGDSNALPLDFTYEITDEPVSRKFNLEHPWLVDSVYEIFIPPASAIDIFGLENDTLKFSFKSRNPETLGNLFLTLKVPEKDHQFILQVCRDKAVVLSERLVKHDETVEFEYLEPGNYILKIIYDENNNGKWDSGKYLEKKQPEKILFYTGDVTIRANWDLDLDWVLEGLPEKEKEEGLEGNKVTVDE